jgi:inorganic pyrophosphatase
VPLVAALATSVGAAPLLNMVTEIPMFTTAKMEVSKAAAGNPLAQDATKAGAPRYYGYGSPFFNYGMLPRTWEDPAACDGVGGACGDDDPLDVMEVGAQPLAMGSVTAVKVLGAFELIDEGETDYKIVVLAASDPDAWRIHDLASLELHKPGTAAKLADWLKRYKTAEGKGENALASEVPSGVAAALEIVAATNMRWSRLVRGEAANPKQHFVGLANPTDSAPAAGLAVLEADAAEARAPAYAAPPLQTATPRLGHTSEQQTQVGGFSSCMALCRTLGGDEMQQQCVASCVEKYGRRRALRAV